MPGRRDRAGTGASKSAMGTEAAAQSAIGDLVGHLSEAWRGVESCRE